MQKSRFQKLIFAAAAILGIVLLNACSPNRTILEQVLDSGELHILTRNAATTYYAGPHGPAGMEYDLAKAFADSLGVKLVINTSDNLKEILNKVHSGEAQIAAAGLTVTEERKKVVRFTPPYQQISQQVVYRRDGTKPESVADLKSGSLEVIANSSHVELLKQLKKQYPDIKWEENNSAGSAALLTLVAEQLIDYTIADSNEIALNRRYYPQLGVAFDLSDSQSLAWAMQPGDDDSLYKKAVSFFNKIKENGELARIVKRNYGHMNRYDYAGTPTYLKHVQFRLPRYQGLFEAAANKHGLDWRLLAAIAYQESHWNPRAVSPTGVRGMMMLTSATARDLGIEKRTDPKQSVEGGTLYFTQLLELYKDIPEPDRTWIALAAYNVGHGHVSDVQKITARLGGNPNKWTDIKENLPLLRQRKWYKTTKYGYARGHEPVIYVENIRSYYDILRWHIERETPRYAPQSILVYASPVL
ncbi:MAG: membrane-bound lytic murein transglycosylase MltF [Gammaproteobacteria bacterium]|jgi:membrane-bound lytic murein transglycosylase F